MRASAFSPFSCIPLLLPNGTNYRYMEGSPIWMTSPHFRSLCAAIIRGRTSAFCNRIQNCFRKWTRSRLQYCSDTATSVVTKCHLNSNIPVRNQSLCLCVCPRYIVSKNVATFTTTTFGAEAFFSLISKDYTRL